MGWEEKERLYYTAVEHSIYIAVDKDSDQVHTDMTLEDFTEGRNIEEDTVDDFGFDFGDLTSAIKTEDNSPKVFTTLKDQYELFKTDLSI